MSIVGVVVFAAGCSGHSRTASSTSSPTSTTTPSQPKASSLIDARWMGFDKTASWNWQDNDRRITTEFQEFGFRPAGETELPHGCNGCGEIPSTAAVRAYAPGKFDPADARTGRSVRVNGADGFVRSAPRPDDVQLAWQYADNAWATATGTTTLTANLDRLLELANALRPDDRSPVRLPLSLPTVPATMPLAAIEIEPAPYGTILVFDQCTNPGPSAKPKCEQEADSLRVQIWQRDGYDSLIDQGRAVDVKIGGKDGKYDKIALQAAVRAAPGMLVVFDLDGPYPNPPTTSLEHLLADVAWAPDPANESSWPAVGDWTN
jgi:hypothetical protein